MVLLFARLLNRPWLSIELLIATLFITVLHLASPIFVIQVLNRYVSHGVTGTLITLTTGVLLAIVLQYCFRQLRTGIARDVSLEPDRQIATRLYEAVAGKQALVLLSEGRANLQEHAGRLHHIRLGLSGENIAMFLDGPCATLYIVAALLISPTLALIALTMTVVGGILGCLHLHLSARATVATQKAGIAQQSVLIAAINNLETMRMFGGARFLSQRFQSSAEMLIQRFRGECAEREWYRSTTLFLTVLLSVILYTVGAMHVVAGTLSTGALIGANILATRAFSTLSSFLLSISLIQRAGREYRELENLFAIDGERTAGARPRFYHGGLSLRGVEFCYPKAPQALFEKVDFSLEQGERLLIVGPNGAGKTTLIRLLTGLLEPDRGSILADRVELRQIDPLWWRAQLMYLPQEPSFLPGTVREAVTMVNPELDDQSLRQIIVVAGLQPFIDQSADGLETFLGDDGRRLPLGIRKRLAMARAMAGGGRLVILDEPTEGLDEAGCQVIYQLLNTFAAAKKTMVIVSRDPRICKAATMVVDLGSKPVPPVRQVNTNDG
jgi:ATP-binding cassette subfamily C protein LapB